MGCLSDKEEEEHKSLLKNGNEESNHLTINNLSTLVETIDQWEKFYLKRYERSKYKSFYKKMKSFFDMIKMVDNLIYQMKKQNNKSDREKLRIEYKNLAENIEKLKEELNTEIETLNANRIQDYDFILDIFIKIHQIYEEVVKEAMGEWKEICLKYMKIRNPSITVQQVEELLDKHDFPLFDWSVIQNKKDDIYQFLFED